ncbi:MAG TPA: metallopeptidase TldD-related protein [bacterium]
MLQVNIGYTDDLDNSVLMRAMADELNRSMTSLQISNQIKPYYLSYRVIDRQACDIEAAFGGLIYSEDERNRDVFVDLRVGSYDFDNSNFICQVSGSESIESDQATLPLDDDYEAIRHGLWLVTDGTYKKALEKFSRKKAYIQNQQVKDEIADFAKVPVCRDDERLAQLRLERAAWELKIGELSSLFRMYPRIQESKVTFHTGVQAQYFLDAEGNRSRRVEMGTSIDVTAKAQSADGDPLEDFMSFCAPEPGQLPPLAEITSSIKAMAETLSLQASLIKEENYSGPVLFTDQAAAELFFQVLGKGVSDPRTPLFENEMMGENMKSGLGGLCGRFGRKVLPDFMFAYDDPTLVNWHGVPLLGAFLIDDQGVRSQRVDIVKEGKLAGFFMNRSPTKKIPGSNGHGRSRSESYGFRYTALPSVMVVGVDDAAAISDPIKTLVQMCKSYGNSYGIIISRLEATLAGDPMERYMRYFAGAGKGKPLLSSPLVAYKIDVETGALTLARGLEFSSATSRILRDIVAVGNTAYTYNFFFRDENGNSYPMSVIAPPVVVEEIDLVTKETKTSKPPVLKHPYFLFHP